MLGRRVVVYGGGNTAMDVARTAKRLGAAEAIVVYRRTRERMPAHDFEVEEAEEEGVLMRWLSTIKQADEGKLLIEKMELDETGFPQPTGEIEELEADSVVLALGQDTDLSLLDGVAGIEVEDGVVRSAPNMMTGHPGIFAGGDMVPDERTVTVGIGHGKKAARHIDGWLRGQAYEPPPKHELVTFDMLNTWYYADAPRTVAAAARPDPPPGRPSTRWCRGSTSRTRCSRRAAASRAATASRATTATASVPTTPCSSSARPRRQRERLRDRPRLLQGLRHLRGRVPVAGRSGWSRRRSDARAGRDQVGLRLRRGIARAARAARRQGREPRRDDARAGRRARPCRASRSPPRRASPTCAPGGTPPDGLADAVDEALARLEERAGRRLGDPDDPLLLSVRSGARDSMPGMMDTVLNLGLNDATVEGLAARTGNPRFAWDCYRRLVQMFGDVVHGVAGARFEDEIAAHQDRARGHARHRARRRRAARADAPLPGALRLPRRPARAARGRRSTPCSSSWMGERAVAYRRIHGIPDDWGTAVNVQQMVYGNKGPTSASGVAFSRDEVTGAPEPSGDFLVDAQGEDVVSGVRTPRDLSELAAWMPEVHAQLMRDPPQARAPLRGHAGHRVHGRGGAPLHAADARRQAARAGGRALRRRRGRARGC